MKAFGIFEGGGAKGLAHIGALKAAEERRIEFVGVAGASAGSIVAALVAVGYSADQLYMPGPKTSGLFTKEFLDFLERAAWGNYQKLQRDLEEIFRRGGPIRTWAALPRTYWRNRSVLSRLFRDRGIFDTTAFAQWLNLRLLERVQKASGPDGAVLFRDIARPLKIVATDVTNQGIKIFSQQTSPEAGVAKAVAASCSIPFFFRPVEVDGTQLVDGGLLSNFPAWLFEDDYWHGADTPIFGFKLVEKTGQPPSGAASLSAFARDLFNTTLSGDEQLKIRQVENLYIVPLVVSTGTFEFEKDQNGKDVLYNQGYRGAREFFVTEGGPQDPQRMRDALEFAHLRMCKCLGRPAHLRVNIIGLTPKSRLRVFYAFNMDQDADDRLEFAIGSGAAGLAWTRGREVICDLQDAKATFGTKYFMTKYQQALVRQSLKSLLCVPIPDIRPNRPPEAPPLAGILNFDSDDDLLADFGSQRVIDEAVKCAKFMAEELIS